MLMLIIIGPTCHAIRIFSYFIQIHVDVEFITRLITLLKFMLKKILF